LEKHVSSGDDKIAVSSLAASDPDPSSHIYWVADTEAVALGLLPASTSIDMFVGFSNTHTFDFDRSDGIAAGAFDFIGTVGHELSEVMGRELGVNENNVNDAPTAHILDLFHYGAVANPYSDRGGYFSIAGGRTTLDNFNPNVGPAPGDAGDWAFTAGNDSFLNNSNPGVYNDISETDLREMDVLG